MKRKKIIIIIMISAAVLLSAAIVAALFYFGVLHINNPDKNDYPVAGVDVSRYQGEIDWKTLSSQDIRFAYIKATEGSSFVDPQFEKNWKDAGNTDLRIGAYHFFSFESSGEKQAELYCNTVERVSNMLPPAIDVEYYGAFNAKSNIDFNAIKQELRVLIDKLTDEYGMKPVIYCDEKTYDSIVKDDFSDCDLWYRSVYSKIPDDIEWTFWQYSNRHALKGYNGKERYIDMNVFCGTASEFETYPN